MVLYPMNALANDQRERLGAIVQALTDVGSSFRPTFGQYIGRRPKIEATAGAPRQHERKSAYLGS